MDCLWNRICMFGNSTVKRAEYTIYSNINTGNADGSYCGHGNLYGRDRTEIQG